jgi:hypothetical protein
LAWRDEDPLTAPPFGGIILQLILADKGRPYEVTYDLGNGGEDGKCHVFSPGSFVGSRFGWTTYFPATRTAEQWYVNIPLLLSLSLSFATLG